MAHTLSQEDQDFLLKRYTSASLPASFTSPRKFYNQLIKEGKYRFTYKQISDWLQNGKGYYFHKQIRKPKKHVPIFAPFPKYCLECDLLSYATLKKHNKNKQYLFALIDQASRKAFGRAINKKTGANIVSALKSIFSTNKFVPMFLKFDQGSEFLNSTVTNYLKSKNIQIILGSNPTFGKNPLIERFFLNFRLRAARIMTQKGTKVWHKFVKQIFQSYNSTSHSSLNNLTPNEAWLMHPADLHIKVYREYKQRKTAQNKIKSISKSSSSHQFKFKISDYVRVALQKDSFFKSFKPTFSTEVYGIRKREMKNNIQLYYLHDLSPKKEDILGSWMTFELQKATPFSDKWEVEKVLKVFKINGIKYAKIRWHGFDRNWDSIVLYSDIEKEIK